MDAIVLIVLGILIGLPIGHFLEAWKWRTKSKAPYIRMLSSGKFYNVLTEEYYDALKKRSNDLAILKIKKHISNAQNK